MVFFFLLVTLEVKRELIVGELNSIKKATLPFIGAIGGMMVPAIIYIIFNLHDKTALKGWAIPMPTDIAFSLAILIFLRLKIPALKIFLTALAIIDDLGAIIIIAFFYSQSLDLLFLLIALCMLIVLFCLNYYNVAKLSAYMLVGLLLWLLVLCSGIHATIAGVLLGLFVPLSNGHNTLPLATKLENKLHPWVIFFILPLFAFANSGLAFNRLTLDAIFHPIPLGIILGLFFGKQLGIFASCWLAIKTKLSNFPRGMRFNHLYGISVLCGIGFTMSLFIGELAFSSTNISHLVIFGVLVGSLLSAILGYLMLKIFSSKTSS